MSNSGIIAWRYIMVKSLKSKEKRTSPYVQLNLFDMIIAEQEKGGGIVTSMLKMRPPSDVWSGLIATPPGSILEAVVSEFDKKTDIPLELPFFTTFHYIAAYLLSRKITLHYGKQIIDPDIWTILLAPSGSGKTFTEDKIRAAIPDFYNIHYDMSGTISNAKYIEDLQKYNRKLHLRDEFNELYKQLAPNTGPMALLKDTILKLYSHSAIHYRTKKEEFQIDDPAIVLLGMTVYDSFTNSISADDLINGFAQRFGYVIAKPDTKKDIRDFPFYSIDTDMWISKWKNLVDSIKHTDYYASQSAMNGFESSFRMLYSGELDKSFYRRQSYRTHKYALVYHIITGNGDKSEIGPEAYGWAARVTHMLIADCCTLLDKHGISELEKKLRAIERVINNYAAKDKEVKPRDVIQNVRSIRTAREAKSLLDLVRSDNRGTMLEHLLTKEDQR